MHYPEIDYSAHPAYAPYQSKLRYDEEFVLQQIQDIDAQHAKFCALTSPSDIDVADALAYAHKRMSQIMLHAKEQNISLLAEEWLDAMVKWTISDFSHEYVRRVFSVREYQGQSLSAEGLRQLSLMQEQGMYITDLPSEVYADIRQLALEQLPGLRQRAIADRFNRAVTNVSFNSPLWKAIKRGAKEAGILDVLSELKQNRMTMLGAGLEYSCSDQNWYQNLYADVGLADSPMRYLHIDESDSLPKSMIYVTSVNEENGPTRAIPGSNQWEKSECRIHMHKALDSVVGMRYGKFAHNAHYRPLARHAELRRIFMELPRQFQGSSHFGDDILAGSALADSLAKQEVPYLSQGGQALVFDGPHLLHRGSLVMNGERMALQVVYRNRNQERIKSHVAKESLLKEQFALAKKYARKIVMGYV